MKGVYVLLVGLDKNMKIKIGSLGKIKLDKGTYAYVGSAQNNLEKRIKRHKLKNKKLKWHIDYLLNDRFAKILKAFYKKAGKQEECKIARRLSKTEFPILDFGSSDCDCKSHLFKVDNLKTINKLGMREIQKC